MANDETDIIKIFEFLIDNIFVMFGGRVFSNMLSAYIRVQTATVYLQIRNSLIIIKM